MQNLNNLIDSEYTNIPKPVFEKLNRNLYLIPSHPLEIIKNKIFNYFKLKHNFTIFENLDKIVSIEDNFDNLLIKSDHVSRSKSDTYYVNPSQVLRTHTTAHQTQIFKQGENAFLVCGDVYRRDEVDSCHYNIFHQLEGALLYNKDDNIDLQNELTNLMTGLCEHLFPGCEYRVSPDYFPFTDPSFEIEVNYNSKWLEILGCGVIQSSILDLSGKSNKKGIAWGLGLERLAMVLFEIPDIRYFWMNDPKFLNQFSSDKITKFIPFSPLDPISKDVSMYVKSEDIDENNNWSRINQFYEIIREFSNDLVSEIKCCDSFYNKKISKQSYCFRLIYSPKDYKMNNPADLNDSVNSIQTEVINKLKTLDWITVRG